MRRRFNVAGLALKGKSSTIRQICIDVSHRFLASSMEGFLRAVDRFLRLGSPNSTRLSAWAIPQNRPSVDARGLIRCKMGSPRMDLDDNRSWRRGDETRYMPPQGLFANTFPVFPEFRMSAEPTFTIMTSIVLSTTVATDDRRTLTNDEGPTIPGGADDSCRCYV